MLFSKTVQQNFLNRRTQLPTFLLAFAALHVFAQTETFHDFKANTITGQKINFSQFYGKKVMVVNTASYCAWTYQYEALEALYEEYKDSNFTILGFPCNDFSNQEPGSDSSINEFCLNTYGITFQMMSKVAIVSHDTAEVYKWLQNKSRNGVADAPVRWNFYKYLIDEAGHWVAYYSNLTEPNDSAIINWIRSPSVLPPDTTTGMAAAARFGMEIGWTAPGRLRMVFKDAVGQETIISLFSPNGQLLSTVFDGIPQVGEVVSVDVSSHAHSLYFLQMKTRESSRTFKVAAIN